MSDTIVEVTRSRVGVPPQRRVRLPLLAAGAGLALVTTLLIVWGFSRAADRTEVLVVVAPVEEGQPIPPEALSTTMIGVDSGTGGFYPPGTDLSEVVAATDLDPGDVLSSALVVAASPAPDGWLEVGASVRPGRFPTTVEVGDELVAVPLEGAVEVTVQLVDSTTTDDGALRVVLAVPADQAAQVSQWAANEALTLVRVP